MFDISVDRGASLVEVTLTGLMSVAEVDRYIATLKRAFVINRLHGYAMLLDVRDCPIQPQEVAESMREHMAGMPKARAIAIVTGRSPARMQVRRLFIQPYARIVDTMEQGYGWAVSGIEPPPSGA